MSNKVHLQMISDLQCPGCVSGPSCEPEDGMSQKCPSFSFNRSSRTCDGHVLGTHIGLGNRVALGMPKGFNKAGPESPKSLEERRRGTMMRSIMDMTFFGSPEEMDWELDHLNVPVWHLKDGDYFFIRVFSPRINLGQILVVKDGDKSLIPEQFNTFDVAEFQNEID